MPRRKRQAAAEAERLKTLAARVVSDRRDRISRHNWLYCACILAWAALAALPSLPVGKPIPYMAGTTAAFDIHSRVDFPWHDALAEAQAMRNLDSTYAWRYREAPLAQWAADTHVPVDQFLVRAAAADTLEEVEQAARELNLPITPEQAAVFWRGAAVARNDPAYYLVQPLKEILDNEIFPRGVIAPDRFEIERGRTIQIMRGDSAVSAAVGGGRGPATPEQLAEFLERRLRLRLSPWIPDEFKTALKEVILKRLKPNLIFDEAGSLADLGERRRELVSRVRTISRNETLVPRSGVITRDRLAMLKEEDRVFRNSQGWRLDAFRFAGNYLLFAAISLSMMLFFKAAARESAGGASLSPFLATAGLCLLIVWSGYLLIHRDIPGTMLPVGLALGVVALGTDARNAIFFSAVASICGLILFDGRSDIMIGHLAAGLLFTATAASCRRRMTLLLVSAASGLIGGLSFMAWNIARGEMRNIFGLAAGWPPSLDESLAPILATLGLILNWLICGAAVIPFIPAIERSFGVTTRISLQDLLTREHPLLRRLVVEAPGTFHHCSLVATLAEAATAAIGADTLRARVGGMFHDIGKLAKPEYFTENESGIGLHGRLAPGMSAMVIINHVRDGAEMARALRLPSVVADMVLQHHGDSLMQFFYHRACQQAPGGTAVATGPFLYPGPRPQTREAGVLMIADSIEAASRSLDDTSPAHLRELISRLIRDRLIDGQFEDSGLTMRQLKRVEEVLFRMLASMFHTRVKYPGQTAKGGDKPGRKP
ncbi:MAG: HDIG domain-containing protein [Planctomycetota bacterium]|jgi:putative nucleotidyltransferase with HDIG domain|nr:HDIG domain-containing protein [Planctomycetota bacterium]